MRWIDMENKEPTDAFPGWAPWTKEVWQAWREESDRLSSELTKKHLEGKILERNELIDRNSEHWGKLKPWLSALSHGKCWFTEAKDIASHMDVEHFRPKNVAKNLDDTERDGYWWLAFDYTNYRFAGNVPNRMKGGWFPLHPKSLSSKHDERCEESETPCLLDPVEQLDADLLSFNEEGDAVPVPGTVDPWILQRVELSVIKFKLNKHDALPDARREVWQKMNRIIKSYLKAKKASKTVNPAARQTMKEKAKEIREMTQPHSPLSSVALWCLRLRPDLERNPELLRLAA